MANTTFSDENTFCPSVPRKKGRVNLLSTKTNMANTTFSDENTFCPSVPRKKGRVNLLSTKTNMANLVSQKRPEQILGNSRTFLDFISMNSH
jgi:hypothetical protein